MSTHQTTIMKSSTMDIASNDANHFKHHDNNYRKDTMSVDGEVDDTMSVNGEVEDAMSVDGEAGDTMSIDGDKWQ